MVGKYVRSQKSAREPGRTEARKPMARKRSHWERDAERVQIKLLRLNGRPKRDSRTCLWKN